jgi:hypothetical protein
MVDDLNVDVVLSPYSSGITGAVSAVTEARNIVLAAGGASSTSKFLGKKVKCNN